MPAGKGVAREEGVSGLKPGVAPTSEEGRAPRRDEPLISRRAADRIAASANGDGASDETEQAIERATQPLAREQRQLEQREDKLEERIDAARERGDDRAVRNLQSERDKLKARLAEVESERDRWPQWLVQQLQAGRKPEQMVEDIRKAQAERVTRQALDSRAEPDAIVAELIDSGDDDDFAFARHLRSRIKDGWPVTHANLQGHRRDFETLRKATTGATPTVVARATTKVPPKVAGAGGGDLGGEKTGWQPGMSTQELLTKGFAEQDAARRH
jgi:hypothetical protein